MFLKANEKDFTGQQVEELFTISKPFAQIIATLHDEKASLEELVFLSAIDKNQKYKAGIHLVEDDFFFTCNPIINSNFLIKGLGKRFGKEVVIQQVENNISDKTAVIFHLTWS